MWCQGAWDNLGPAQLQRLFPTEAEAETSTAGPLLGPSASVRSREPLAQVPASQLQLKMRPRLQSQGPIAKEPLLAFTQQWGPGVVCHMRGAQAHLCRHTATAPSVGGAFCASVTVGFPKRCPPVAAQLQLHTLLPKLHGLPAVSWPSTPRHVLHPPPALCPGSPLPSALGLLPASAPNF